MPPEETESVSRNIRFNRSMNTKTDNTAVSDVNGDNSGEETGSVNQRKSLSVSILLMSMTVAILGDIVGIIFNLLPGIGGMISSIIVTPVAGGVIWFLMKIDGVSFSKKRVGAMAVCMCIEFIPIFNAIPALTAAVIGTEIIAKAEEMAGVKPEDVVGISTGVKK